jgi:putative SOS response-associated peptidase YedK
MSNYDTLDELISARRDDIYEWATDRFKQLMSEDRLDDALALADEFFEWLDPEQLHNEQTLFYNEEQLQQYFIELTEG